ncbi:flagellar assembly protein FliH [Bacillus mesophilus]|uniref:Flagellar assembly protein FliH n=1 Tax=Bacillus mesophilus TaxID=1808955 RepID=A0A6M0Q1T0_9BACI|nr:flagellar assembly protein FliH [Bacillus mesophilus]MBM7659364.1 flagellar assembly protein FliH [Bacillus mesophilus]NEY70236.1 flagellar assembly protein FliH [Bacillus mesophilus]
MSRLLKSHYATPQDEVKKVIKLQPIVFQQSLDEESPEILRVKASQEAESLLANAKSQSEAMIYEAKQRLQLINEQINEMKFAWETEKEKLFEEVKAEAFQVGFQQGEVAAVEQYSAIIKEGCHIVEQAKLDYISQVELAEETILKLGIKVAEKILRVHLDETKDDFIQLVKHAIKEVKDYTDINIMVHPSMYEMVLAQKDELKALFNGDKSLYIYPNEELRETGCLIESSFGRIDASIDSQLNELKVKLLELIEEE